jgi:hypothetical protein
MPGDDKIDVYLCCMSTRIDMVSRILESVVTIVCGVAFSIYNPPVLSAIVLMFPNPRTPCCAGLPSPVTTTVLYHSYCRSIIAHTLLQITGKKVTALLSLDVLRMYLERYKALKRELNTLQNAAVKEKQVPRQIELNSAIRKVRDQCLEIEAILNGGRVNEVVSGV